MGGKRPLAHRNREVPIELPLHVLELLGEEAGTLLHELQQPAPVSIRGNPLKPVPLAGVSVPWCSQGRYLDQRPVFTLDPLFHAGAYYVQEAASMLVEQALQAVGLLPVEAMVLDLCAAPGGKSTHLASLIPEGALLVANELIQARQAPLLENLWKWGRSNVVATGANPEAFAALGPVFDLILVDAPCSGEGMFRKDPHARAQWGPNLVAGCALRQQKILDAAWAALKPGGHLIYSTCTWETCENEQQVQRLAALGAQVVPLPVNPAWGVETGEFGLRCWPHRVCGEGFFIALLRKHGSLDTHARHTAAPENGLDSAMQNWIRQPKQWAAMPQEDVVHAIGMQWAGVVNQLRAALPVVAPGIPIALRKGATWIPHPAWALNVCLENQAFQRLELDREQILRYLRGEALPAHAAQGTMLVSYQGLPMGWANGTGNRYNNRWPAPWRIRMR